MSMIKHHASIDTLAEYAAGQMDEARNVVIATHLRLCKQCREIVRDIEAIGGVCLEDAEPVAMAEGALSTFWKIADHAEPITRSASTQPDNDLRPEVALPLSAYLPGGLDAANWRPVAPGVSQSIIEAEGYRRNTLRLLRINPGTKIPTHSHGAQELTMILRGAYRDQTGDYGAGDLADLDGSHTHSPEAFGDEPCICLIATSAPLVFKDMVGKVIQPFVGL
ncbi:MAG: ChrR family anti-sigma-E factor [Pseudomonadota bacterium]